MADLREQLSQALEQTTNSEEQTPPSPGAGADAPVASEQTPASSEPSKLGRTAGRPRDEQGRLLPGKAEKISAAETGKPATPTQTSEQSPAAAPAAEPPKIPRPSSWKKEMWPLWDKLAAGQALTPEEAKQWLDYGTQRESEFAKGVSTYKQEFERAKPLLDAVAPHLPLLQHHGLDPAQQIDRYLKIHQNLALGTPEQKLSTFLGLAQEFNVPIQQMFVRGQDGQVYFNPQLQQRAQTQQAQQPDVRQVVREMLTVQQAEQQVQQARADKQNYPHFEQVEKTMAGLLQSGLFQDLKSAYDAALRLPQHSDIFEAMQEQQRQDSERKKQEEAQRTAQRARSNAVSPKSASSTGAATTQGKKGLRAAIEESAEAFLSGSRV